ncbi:CPBP family glutamic-type intramembrane protease [Streptomyces zaomyceticus]|uniref:CPBP family glutamic-type intramembrane protease n=1 Tax=Streptomyces zaomyceticus TaxID=68286 RepID=UPI0036CCED0B
MTAEPLLTALPYHRMARYTGHHRWWRPVLGLLLLGAGWIIAVVVIELVSRGVGVAAGRPKTPDGLVDLGELPTAALGLVLIATMLPLVLLAVRWAGRRPAGTVSSVTGQLRLRWLGWCLGAAAPAVAVLSLVLAFVPFDDGSGTSAVPERWVGWSSFAVSMAVLVVCVPLQAAAEEYLFRGWMTQAVGAFLRSPWCAVVPQAALFGAAHGWGTVWGFVDLCVFGLVTGYLTLRTGGLEAAIALHVLNNLLGFTVAASVVGGLSSEETTADAPALLAVIDIAVALLYAALVLWLTQRHQPQRISTSATRPVPMPPYPSAPLPDIRIVRP